MDSFHSPLSLCGIGQLSPPIPHLSVLQEVVVLLPSRADLFPVTHLFPSQFSIFRSYGANWPSSFAIVLLKPLCIPHIPTCVGFKYGSFTVTFDSFRGHFDLVLAFSCIRSLNEVTTSRICVLSLFSPYGFPSTFLKPTSDNNRSQT
jgi:hypothetical protein